MRWYEDLPTSVTNVNNVSMEWLASAVGSYGGWRQAAAPAALITNATTAPCPASRRGLVVFVQGDHRRGFTFLRSTIRLGSHARDSTTLPRPTPRRAESSESTVSGQGHELGEWFLVYFSLCCVFYGFVGYRLLIKYLLVLAISPPNYLRDLTKILSSYLNWASQNRRRINGFHI